MREITSHKVNGLNEVLRITAWDEPGPGGAHHKYLVEPTIGKGSGIYIDFQKGPLGETEFPNGLSNEALLAIVEDRLKCFQAGPYACRENALALTKLQEAMMWLHRRTSERAQRGVEGTSKV